MNIRSKQENNWRPLAKKLHKPNKRLITSDLVPTQMLKVLYKQPKMHSLLRLLELKELLMLKRQ